MSAREGVSYWTRALHALLLLVLALVALEYTTGSILDSESGLRAYLAPATRAAWPERLHPAPLPVTERQLDRDDSVTTTTAEDSLTTEASGYATELPLCPAVPPDLGPVEVDKTVVTEDDLARRYPLVRLGGRHAPSECRARHRVAIVVPFRDRAEHLAIFLNNLHPILMKQQLDYGIFVVEQAGDKPFNRAKLMNVGYAEAQASRRGGWQCFVFHDVDLLPLDSRNMYSCPRQPRHMSAAIDYFRFKLPYQEIFGGVSALTAEQFRAVNGFSNQYWGWGGEDDDMFRRLKANGLHVARYPMSVARYTMLDHKKQQSNPKRYSLLAQTHKVYTQDGLSSLQYRLLQRDLHALYTHVMVDIDEPS